MRQYQKRDNSVPTPHPDGGVFHLIPMDQHDLKKLARKVVRIDYLQDARGKTVFNQHGQAVPRVEQDDVAAIDEAMKRCVKITDIAMPVFRGGEQETDDEGKPKTQAFVASDATEPVLIGDVEFVPVKVKRDILQEAYEHELEDEPEDEPKSDEASEGAPSTTAPKKKVKRKITQLVAEWVIDECSKLATAKKEVEVKN
jgi:hypothetical protein